MDPERVSHYRILEKLGEGGMGEVYLAEDMKLGRKIAIKILSEEFTTNKDRLHRFEQEASAASNLNHPNILTIYELGVDDGRHYIGREICERQGIKAMLTGSIASLGSHYVITLEALNPRSGDPIAREYIE